MNTTKIVEKASYFGKNIYIGIDVHEKSWNISLFLEDQYIRSFTQRPSVEALEAFLKKQYPKANYQCGYESGYSGFSIQRLFSQHGISCHVLHAGDIPQTNKEKLTKRDPVDSRKIGESLAIKKAKPIFIPDESSEQDRSLIRYHDRLQRDIARSKNRIRSILYEFGISIPERFSKSWSNLYLQWLKETNQAIGTTRTTLNFMIEQLVTLRKLLLKVNREIRILQKSPRYKNQIEYLRSIPGIGPLGTMILLTEIIDIQRFSSFRQLNSYVGLYPMEHSTSDNVHQGHMMIRHNCFLRKFLVECAWTAMRHDPALTLAFNTWIQRMTKKRAIIKVARKLLSRVRYVLLNETYYVKGIVK